VLVIHHIVVDFWSLAVILNELGVLYRRKRLVNRQLSLHSICNTRTSFVGRPKCWRVRPANGSWTTGRNNWTARLPVLNLPTDRPRPPIQMFRGAQHDFTLNEELTHRLRALAKAEG